MLERELFAKHKELNLDGKVFFAGLQTNVKPYFEAMDIFMMTSSFEGLPIALLEAMSMSCAVIATDAGGVKEVLRSDTDGILVTVDQWQTLPKSLLYLAENQKQLSYYQSQARKRVVNSFSIEVMVEQLEVLYLKQTQ